MSQIGQSSGWFNSINSETAARALFTRSLERGVNTFIPSFTLGGIQIEHLDFDIETIRPVIDFSNAAFRCIWAAIYLVVFFVFVWFVGARVFRVMLWLVQFISGSLGN